MIRINEVMICTTHSSHPSMRIAVMAAIGCSLVRWTRSHPASSVIAPMDYHGMKSKMERWMILKTRMPAIWIPTHALTDSDHPSEEDIRNFYFYFSGSVVRVIALTDAYADLAKAFNAYAESSSLCEWRMLPGSIADPAALAQVDRDLVNLSVYSSPYFERIEE